ncbi:MAG TPA: creatininase family protein [Thermomicrobiales bacterium]|nr:creatininase family protein [Thermomicrobiales bacterium]
MSATGTRLLLQELTREEARAIAPRALVVFPTGATEQHGPHLPVGTDHFAVEHVAREAAALVAAEIPVVVAPTLPFGSSHHHLPFGGTMSLSTETYYRVLIDLAESLITDGFRRIFIVNGHGGNDELVQLAARDLALRHQASLAAASYWTIAWDALVGVEAHADGGLPGHAGAFESSLVLALRPELVQEPRPRRDDATGADPRGVRRPYRAEHHGSWQRMDGYTDSPARATAEHGRAYLAAAARAVADALREFYAAAESSVS